MSTEGKDLQIISYEGNALQYIDELVQLDAICLGKYGETWRKENFLLGLPQKGKLSKLAILRGNLIGYLIGSSYDGSGHIHRLAVNPTFEKSGIGTKLLWEFARECLTLKIHQITVETPLENITANNFYRNIGFHRFKDLQLRDYLLQKDKHAQIIHYTGQSESRAVYLAMVKQLYRTLDAMEEDREST